MGRAATVIICLVFVFGVSIPALADIVLLHEFEGGNGDGGTPYGQAVLDSGYLCGMTYSGGDVLEEEIWIPAFPEALWLQDFLGQTALGYAGMTMRRGGF